MTDTCEVLELAPAKVLVGAAFLIHPRGEDRVLKRLARAVGLVLGPRLILIQALQEEQIRNLLDHFQSDLDKGMDRDAGFVYGPATPRTFFAGINLKI